MAIPGLFVYALIADRAGRAQSVVQQVSELRGGAQQVLGPVFVAPFETLDDKGKVIGQGWWIVSPQSGSANVTVKSESLHRGIFSVPVFDATINFAANFGALQKAAAPPNVRIDWDLGRVVLGFSDLRGAKSDIQAKVVGGPAGSDIEFAPASSINLDATAAQTQQTLSDAGPFGLVSGPAPALLASQTGAAVFATLKLTGAQRLSVMPFAKTTKVSMIGDWPSPSFDGGFLPDQRQVGVARFTASWTVPFVARGLSDQGPSSAISLTELGKRDVGVTFARTNNPYENVQRSLKYGVMFIGLVFLTFFLFEALSGQRLHPAQYVLIGLAQMIFYLLLLSISEYLGFDAGFVIAAAATVGLIGFYAGWAFKSARYRLRALVIFSILYALIYCLMRLEDFALLAGSIASFTGLAVAMYLTRNLDWYGSRVALSTNRAPSDGPPESS